LDKLIKFTIVSVRKRSEFFFFSISGYDSRSRFFLKKILKMMEKRKEKDEGK
jgi:hypothetical protein